MSSELRVPWQVKLFSSKDAPRILRNTLRLCWKRASDQETATIVAVARVVAHRVRVPIDDLRRVHAAVLDVVQPAGSKQIFVERIRRGSLSLTLRSLLVNNTTFVFAVQRDAADADEF